MRVVSALLGKLFDFSISVVGVVVALIFLALFGGSAEGPAVTISWSLLLVAPLMLMVVLMIAGLGLTLATANVFLRDVSSMGTSVGPETFRVAVKDAPTNARVLSSIATHSVQVASGRIGQ